MITVIYPETAFVSKGANKVKPLTLVKSVQANGAITTVIRDVRIDNKGSGSTPDVDDPTGRTWAFDFDGSGSLPGPEQVELDAIVAAHNGVEAYDTSPRNGGTIGQVWSNVTGSSYGWATPPGSGGGEANTASNAGASGIGIALPKIGTDLPFAKINATNGLAGSLGSDVLTLSATALLPRDGTRAMTGALDLGSFAITNVGNVDGRDVSVDGATLDAHDGSTVKHLPASLGTALQQLRVNAGATTPEWFTPASPGEVNTTSNAGATGTGLALTKVGSDLPIAKIDGVNGISESLISSVMTLDGVALLPRDGSRAMTGALDMGGQAVTNVGNVDGRDVSADGATLTGHVGNSLIHVPALGTALQVLRVNAGASATEWATPAGGGSPGGAEGDLQFKNGAAFAGASGYAYENAVGLIVAATPPGTSSLNGAGLYRDAWNRPQFSEPNGYSMFDAAHANRVGFSVVGAGSTGSRPIGGTSALVASGTATATTYTTAGARSASKVLSFVPATTANLICSGAHLLGTTIRLPLNSEVAHGALRSRFSARFGLSVSSASNARFFAGIASTPTSFSANPTASGSGMGARMGIGFGDNNAGVLQWIVTQSAEANSVVSTGITATDGDMYYVEMCTIPLSAEVQGKLWSQTTAGGVWTLVSSYSYDTTGNVLSATSLGMLVAGGNGSVASGALTVYLDFAMAEMR